jgi:hypothetical protein
MGAIECQPNGDVARLNVVVEQIPLHTGQVGAGRLSFKPGAGLRVSTSLHHKIQTGAGTDGLL